MNYIEYIHDNSCRVLTNRQEPFTVEGIYRSNYVKLLDINNTFFQQRVRELSGIPLSRDFVRNSFNISFYTGFVATMLWGGLGVNSWNQVVAAMTMDKPEVECKIDNLQKFLDNDNIRDAFLSLQVTRNCIYSNVNKFNGVDISYFTKLLFFIYRGDSKVPPLIFDKWGTYIHAGLLISQGEIGTLNRFYRLGYNNNNKFYIAIKSNRATDYRCAVYLDYLQRMASLASNLNITNPGILEEFLFGKELIIRENKNNNNPRFFVKNYVKQYYDSLEH